MRHPFFLFGSTVTALGMLYALFVERINEGFIVSVGTYVADPIGDVKLAYTRATRDCSVIQRVTPKSLVSALAASNLDLDLKAEHPSPRAGWKLNDWLLIETEFDNLEPAVFLVRQRLNKFEVLSTYSGSAAPFNDTQAIHQYFIAQREDAPITLVQCYEPVGAPFAHLS